MIEGLTTAIRNKEVIFFVGAGVSRSLGLPTWDELIGDVAKELGYDPDLFKGYGDYLTLAEFYKLKQKSLGALRSRMDREWHKDESLVDASQIHSAIVELAPPIIYTTNYDNWLELAFARKDKAYTKIANVGDFPKIADGRTQIVKLHGDFSDDNSLVLTESSYFERMSFESPLDIKFRADSIGRSIFFVGYSLSDINIRYLLFKLQRLWSNTLYEHVRPKSYIFLTRPNPIQEEVLTSRGIVPVVSDQDDPRRGLADFLTKLSSHK